ncbi:NADH-quinone oxidoreductase subunit NuoF [Serpentinicella alkaliphila]|uniref:NAD(P)-dependent iron-only hydrogenase diaphorase component flavoprotein n=1 Tax=Serpentinicella alkaliphila TaxID=1734049 RepID=A0A4R2TZE0_9FIRM|nr:NADH-quinone oxidoreductase subunit NuoF [Serpentinicella alkaliphila]QUH24643.1 NADH-quinone oxidoreductase subunit NuoF [Serpentinicella alkaliphila]TCQ03099.1 NAD(P)-dependent iron-only hydrogenase diaphorase component flavoprotein [Serpentinicella alkaliphila]
MSKYRSHILVCVGTGCQSQESNDLIEQLKHELKSRGYEEEIQVVKTGCFGFCEKGPIIKILPEDVFYIEVKPSDAKEIVEEHIVKGRRVERLLYEEPNIQKRLEEQHDIPFYKKQIRIALRNCGLINPEDIREYIAVDGYLALGKALTEMKQEEVIKLVKDSGLRGRGGGGFSTGYKWELTYNNKNDLKFIICNADEGDPGAFMDRSILEGDPHSVLEAMAIGAYAIGAEKGYVYIRAEYPLAIHRLKIAIEQARKYGFLGEGVFGTKFNFDIELKYGAGAFVCGEETALLNSIEGGRGEPNAKPPFPAESGLWNRPTCVNNVETFANVPPILLNGPEWFNKIGTEKSRGTKVFALAGKVNNVGLIEVPMGIKMREVIFDIGGGIRDGKKFKAVQTGGPSGGCIPEELLDTAIDFESLKEIGSMMGSGGMIVMDEDDCMVNIAKFYLEFTEEESCGKCTPCRIGNRRLHEILIKITEGKGTKEDLEDLKRLGEMIKISSLCGLGQSSPNPVLSTLKYFYNEYEQHVFNKHCPAGVCTALKKYEIMSDNCKGCTLCKKVCPVECIEGNTKEAHKIDPEKCIKCGACFEACKFNAIAK